MAPRANWKGHLRLSLGLRQVDETRDVISNIYMRRVERVNGELWNIEFATVENVKDPVKAAKK
jgi:hypothetical protein